MAYDPFAPGPLAVEARTIEASDPARGRLFPCDLWLPERQGEHPLIVFSHSSAGNRRSASFLCTHLASHGYAVAWLCPRSSPWWARWWRWLPPEASTPGRGYFR
ncbi:MAG: hypothetical protein E6J00_12855 [Chloroflexi bacterium]|nr:MAG: hypothetical protein E6J00_12855 [Chloroflexota bacterium]